MKNSNSKTVCQRFAEWICGVQLEDIPARTLEKARLQTLSVLACVYAGFDSEEAEAVRRAVTGWAARGPCTVVPSGEKLALHDAVFLNCAHSMALDFDDYLYMGHTGHSAVMAGRAICEAEGLGGGAALLAQVIGNEIGARLGASVALGPQNGQAWSFIHAAEGAAIAARLLKLDVEQTAHALAIALYQPTFTLWPGFMGPGGKAITASGPTVSGMQAAQMARHGLTGALDIVEKADGGFWSRFAFAPLPGMTKGLGRAWLSDTLTFKKHPGCAYIGTAMDALFLIAEELEKRGERLNPADIKRVRVDASLLTVEMDNLCARFERAGEPLTPSTVNFSTPYSLAIGMLEGRLTGAEMAPEFLLKNEVEIRGLASKIEIRHDWSMSERVFESFNVATGGATAAAELSAADIGKIIAGYMGHLGWRKKFSVGLQKLPAQLGGAGLARLAKIGLRADGAKAAEAGLDHADFSGFEMTFPAKVEIEWQNGRRLSARQDIPFGAPGQQRQFETVEEKFLREAVRLMPEEAARRLMAGILKIETFGPNQIPLGIPAK